MKPTISYCSACRVSHPPGEHTKGRRPSPDAEADAPAPKKPKPSPPMKAVAAPRAPGRTRAAVKPRASKAVVTAVAKSAKKLTKLPTSTTIEMTPEMHEALQAPAKIAVFDDPLAELKRRQRLKADAQARWRANKKAKAGVT